MFQLSNAEYKNLRFQFEILNLENIYGQVIDSNTLVAITLLVAQSDPKEKIY